MITGQFEKHYSGFESAYERRMTEQVRYHGHVGVAFPGYHIRTEGGRRIYECSQCGKEFTEQSAADTDNR